MYISIKSAIVLETPSYEGKDDEGYPTSLFDYVVMATDYDDCEWTHRKTFNYNDGLDAPMFFAVKVEDQGSINTDFWDEGNPWDRYKVPQTYEEEKAQALEFEYDNPTIGW